MGLLPDLSLYAILHCPSNCCLCINVLSPHSREDIPGQFVNVTNAGLIVPVNNPNAFIYNSHSKQLTVLLFVRAYSQDGKSEQFQLKPLAVLVYVGVGIKNVCSSLCSITCSMFFLYFLNDHVQPLD